MLLGLYLLPIKLNIKIPESSHTSALSYDPIVKLKLYTYIYIYNIYIYICFTPGRLIVTVFYITMKLLITKWYIPSIQKSKTLKIKPTSIF